MKSGDAGRARDASAPVLPVGRRGVLIALLAAFVFGLVIKAAFAVEYHTVSGLPHGWVAGESSSDGSWSRDFFTDSPTECHWRAYVGNGSPVSVHHHVADNYCG